MLQHDGFDADSFFGRTDDLARVRSALSGASRLVTLSGPPGVGKSRLAMEAGRVALAYGDGAPIVECDLHGVRDVDGLCTRVSTAVCGSQPAARPADLVAGVAALLAERAPRLVILDDVDRLVDTAVDPLQQWLAAAPSTSFLLTSRQRLHVTAERVIEVDPLSTAAAERLFHHCAQAIQHEWSTADNQAVVAQIAARLDRLPLALELAAGRMDVMSPAALLAELEHRLDILAGPQGKPGAHHKSLTAAILASCDGLPALERAALTRASVFRASFSLEAARAVLEVGELPRLLDALSGLRNRSLLRASCAGTGDQQVRFTLYETVRVVARRLLEESGDAPATLERHAGYFTGTDVDWIEEDLTDMTAVASDATAPGLALRAAFAAEPLLYRTGRAGQVEALLSPLLRSPAVEQLSIAQRAKAYELRGRARRAQGAIVDSARDLETALAGWDEIDDVGGRGRALHELGIVELAHGRPARGAELLERAASEHRRCGDALGEASALDGIAGALYEQGHPISESRPYTLRALRIARRVGARAKEAMFRSHLGLYSFEECIYSEARTELEAALVIHRELGDIRFEAAALNNLALVHQEQGDLDAAIAMLTDALALQRTSGSSRGIGLTLIDLGTCWDDVPDFSASAAAYAEALSIGRLIEEHRIVALALSYLGRVSARTGNESAARHSFSQADQILIDHPNQPVSAVLAVCRKHLADTSAGSDAVPGRRPHAVRAALRILARTANHATRAVTVERGTLSFSFGTQQSVSLASRPTLWRIVECLAAQRLESPQVPVARDALIAAGWPDERIATKSAVGRLRSAVYALRKMGLADAISSSREGYAFSPDVELHVR